jgi:hypothetical protein
MGSSGEGPKLFTCPKCHKVYLGRDPLPDCPACGFDYRDRGGFRWDVLVYLLSILGLMSYLLISSSYRSVLDGTTFRGDMPSYGEKLPGADRSGSAGAQSQDARH